MGEKIKCTLTYNHFNRNCSEEIFLDINDYENDAKNILDAFNNVENRRKKINPEYHRDIRTFVSVEKQDEKIHYCNFEKKNMISQKDNRGYYDFLECPRCLRVFKRYTLHTPINLVCNPDLICQKCRKEFKTEKGIKKHISLNKCKKHLLK